jgi:hypothetical protein
MVPLYRVCLLGVPLYSIVDDALLGADSVEADGVEPW